MKILYRILVCCVAVCITAACSSTAHIVIRDNTDYDLTAEFVPGSLLEKNITHLLKQKNEQVDGQSIFNTQELKEAFIKEGISVQNIALQGALGLRLVCTVPHNHELLKDVIAYDKKGRKAVLRISPENIASFLEMLPQESRDFIDMLMAPLFTGDNIPSAEYEELIGAAYGKKIAAELRSAEFVLTVDVPYKIQTARISPVGTVTVQTKTEKTSRASIRIPLLELLCTAGTIEAQLQ
ncbi:hypothetical protein HMPREF9195_02198 [Treponema medium ATCC 700293]|uniref:Lipoprotein n=2 Tax=Treponema medium TaxID=58231 RepID=A0AA87NQJ5_TREMD|nr:hypothetical protein [Treponema medium]EPF27700.1 hypothetical protein HMPREF9195_02198 [Treponema medium ATCC 700293]